MNIFGKTDIGKIRRMNQDSFSFGYLAGGSAFAIVCDGMGGQKSGNVASKLACTIAQLYIKSNFKPGLTPRDVKRISTDAVIFANKYIYDLSSTKEEYEGMGTTFVSFLVCDNIGHVVNVGDSRVYTYTNNELIQVTKDHSFVQSLVEQGKISAEEANTHPQKNIITRALGVSSMIDIDYKTVDITKNSKILLCTDGLTSYCDEKFIVDTISKNNSEDLCDIFINYVNDQGGSDNVTVVILSSDDKI